MPLITCPDCGTQISDAAPACVKCGRPMAAPVVSPTESQLVEAGQKTVNYALTVFVLLVALCAACIVALNQCAKYADTIKSNSVGP